MKQIKDGLLYDTDKSELIHSFCIGAAGVNLYITKNKRLFTILGDRILSTDQSELLNFLGAENPDKYIELFGEVEEA